MSASLQNIRRRLRAMRSFSATGEEWSDKLKLAVAGLARHRPFGRDSLYGRLGLFLSGSQPARVAAAGGQRIGLNLTRTDEAMIFEEIFIDHTYPMEKVPFVPDVVIDCGAFSGMFTLLARARFPSARFIAFEPEPKNITRVRENFALNTADVEFVTAAVGTSDGTINFSGAGFGGHVTGEGEANSISVQLVSLANLLRQIQPVRLLLKLDVEGSEREILPDILPLLPPDTVIFLETHHAEDECQRYLQPCIAAGFTHELIRNRHALSEPTLFLERMLVRHIPVERHFCTYFDSNYSAMGLALYHSLRRHHPFFRLWVLCLDDDCHALLTRLALPGLEPIRMADFEEGDTALLAAKANRRRIEYSFTFTPSLPLYLLRKNPGIDLITYVDSDLYFFSSPGPMFSSLGRNSIGIIPHRFSPENAHLAENGIYNVGWLSFRRDESGLACLQWWRERCLEWCYLQHSEGRYADQKYLDQWPKLFKGVVEITLPGANLAMWNVGGHRLSRNGWGVKVNRHPLIFFHFHGLRRPYRALFNLSTAYYRVTASHVLLWIFSPRTSANSSAWNKSRGFIAVPVAMPPRRAKCPFA